MAGRSGKTTVINININEDGGIFDLLGQGLVPVHHSFPSAKDTIDVNAGAGLGFDADDRLVVDAGEGLTVDPNNKLTLDLGTGFAMTDGQVHVDVASLAGPGLQVSDDGKLEFGGGNLAGTGLISDWEGTLSVDTAALIGDGLAVNDTGKIVVNTAAIQGDGLTLDTESRLTVDLAALAGDGIDVLGNRLAINLDGVTSVIKLLTDVNIGLDKDNLTLSKTVTDYAVRRNPHGVIVGLDQGQSVVTNETVVIPDGYGYTSILSVPNREGSTESPNFYNKG